MPVGIVEPQQRADPIPNFGFALQMGSKIVGWFTEIGSLTIERKVTSHREGGVNDYVHQLPDRLQRSNITLKHGLAGNELWEWFQKGMYDGKVERRNISIVLYNINLTEVKRWDLVDVYPAKWSGSNLNSAQKEIFIESVEFAYVGSNGAGSAVQRAEAEPTAESPAPAAQPAINTELLAQKVYKLLKQEIKLERERLG